MDKGFKSAYIDGPARMRMELLSRKPLSAKRGPKPTISPFDKKKLRKFRESLGLSQTKMSLELDWSGHKISKIENGGQHFSEKIARQIEARYNVSVEKFRRTTSATLLTDLEDAFFQLLEGYLERDVLEYLSKWAESQCRSPSQQINWVIKSHMISKDKVHCPLCGGDGHLGQEECSVCHGEGSIPREMATYEAQAKGDY
mgnify:FL=1|tara:strand:+ start:291 stop:890 length:600 start_codon:yes stop_codon:yes gene_type:complete